MLITGTDGDDVLNGTAGADTFNGGPGNDTYVFGPGSGMDTVMDPAGADRVLLVGGLTPQDVTVGRTPRDLIITINSTGEALTLKDWFAFPTRVETIEFSGGPIIDSTTLANTLDNQPPTAVDDFASVLEDATSPATGNVLQNDSDESGSGLTVKNAGDYQGTYGTLSLAADGSYSYALNSNLPEIQALGAGQALTESFAYGAFYVVSDNVPLNPQEATGYITVTVQGANDAPVVATPLTDQTATGGNAFSFALAAGAFTDVDSGDSLAFSATLADGAAFPAWLAFDPATQQFSGTAPAAAGGTALDIKITATDLAGAQASDSFAFAVAGTDTPGDGDPHGHGRVIIGTRRDDHLVGTPYDDVIDGRRGFDVMVGGAGDDIYFVDETHRRHHGHRVDEVVERPNEGHDTVFSKASYALPANVEDLHLLGKQNLNGTGNGLDNWIEGNRGRNTLKGGAGDDFLQGHGGNDLLRGGRGTDVLQGGSGNDKLIDRSGSSVLDGGRGNDDITGSRHADFFAGGRGNDKLHLGGGDDVVAFNKGDGVDRLYGERQDGVLSLGGGIRYEDLRFRKQGDDLVLKTGGGDRIVLEDWYGGKQSVVTLQVVAEAMAGFSQGSGDSLRDDKIELFDFRKLVAAFDDARACERNMHSWKLMGELLDAHLVGSDSAALGGDLAYRYGVAGTLAGVGLSAARDTVAAPGFGADLQAMHSQAALAADPVKLGS